MSNIIDHVTIGDVPYGLRHWTAMVLGPSIGVTVYINSPLHASQSVHGVSSPIVSSIAPAGHVICNVTFTSFVYTAPLLIVNVPTPGGSLSKIVPVAIH